MKKFTFFKTLLVAAGLLGGSSAWADITTSTTTINEVKYEVTTIDFSSWTLGSTLAVESDVYATTNGNSVYKMTSPAALSAYMALTNSLSGKNYLWFRDSKRLYAYGAGKYVAFLNLKAGDKIVVTEDYAPMSGEDLTTENTNFYTTSNNDNDFTFESSIDATAKTVTAVVGEKDGELGFRIAKNKGITKIVITRVAALIATPTAEITAVNGISRTVSLSCETDGVTYQYKAPDAEEYTNADGTSFIASVVGTYTIRAKKDAGYSNELLFNPDAGYIIPLNAPALSVSGMALNGSAYYPVYSVSYNASGVLGTPEAQSFNYTFTPTTGDVVQGSIAIGGTYTFTQPGTLSIVSVAPSTYANSGSTDVTIARGYVQKLAYDFSDENFLLNENWGSGTANRSFASNWPTGIRYIPTSTETAGTSLIDGLSFDVQANYLYFVTGLGIGLNGANGTNITRVDAESTDIAFFTTYSNYSETTNNNYVSGTNVYRLGKVSGSNPTALKSVYSYGVLPESVSTTVSSVGYATFSSTYALDLDHISGGTAYVVTSAANGYIHLEEASGVVPANTGLILKAENGGTVTIPVSASAGTAPTTNYLVAVTADNTTVTAGNYVLAAEDDVAGFYLIGKTTATLNAGKAYLSSDIPVSGGAKARLLFADDATAIKTIAVDAAESGAIYNVAGQRVNAAYKGIVIKNGKKYLNK